MRNFFLTIIFGVIFSSSSFINAQNVTKEWAFVNKKNGYARVLKQDQKIKVYWEGKRGLDISWGKLADISEDSLFLTSKNYTKAIAKKDIQEIRVRRHRTIAQKTAGFGLIIGGILITGLFLLFQAISNVSRLDVQLAAGEQKLIWPWAFLGIGMIVWGAVRLGSSKVVTYNPFGDKWIVQEILAKPRNQP